MTFPRLVSDAGPSSPGLTLLREVLTLARTTPVTPAVLARLTAAWAALESPANRVLLARAAAEDASAVLAVLTLLEAVPGQAARAGRLRASLLTPLPTVADALEVLPPPALLHPQTSAALRVPPGYTLSEAGVFGPQGQVALAPCLIGARVAEADGSASRHLLWRGEGGWREAVVERAVLERPATLAALLARLDGPARPGQGKGFAQYLADFEAENAPRLPTLHRTDHLGWQADESFLLPDVQVPALEREAVSWIAPVAPPWRVGGTQEGWMRAMEAVLPYSRAMLLVYASLAAPLCGLLRVPPFAVHLFGETAQGKSTALRLALSVWGVGGVGRDSLLRSWDNTADWRAPAALARDLPFGLDDTRPARGWSVVQTLEGYCAESGAYSGVLLSTGRERITATKTQNQASIESRVLQVGGAPLGGHIEQGGALAVFVQGQIDQHYGHLGRAFLERLQRLSRATLRERFEVLHHAAQRQALTPQAKRLSRAIAVLELAALLAHEVVDGEALLPPAQSDPFPEVYRGLAQVETALRDFGAWAVKNHARFPFLYREKIHGTGRWGCRTTRSLMVEREPFAAWALQKGLDPDFLLEAWGRTETPYRPPAPGAHSVITYPDGNTVAVHIFALVDLGAMGVSFNQRDLTRHGGGWREWEEKKGARWQKGKGWTKKPRKPKKGVDEEGP